MSRPFTLFAHRLGRDMHIDADVILSWPIDKIYRYMAFYITESEDFKKKQKFNNEPMSFEAICEMMDRDGALVKDER